MGCKTWYNHYTCGGLGFKKWLAYTMFWSHSMADLHYRIMWLLPCPSGGYSSFSFSIQNVWQMTTLVDKTACRSCAACHPATVLRLSIADTISSDKVYSQYVKALHTQQKHGKFYCHYCGTTARPTKNRLTRLVLRQPAKIIFPRLHCTAGPSQLLSWKYCRGATTISPTLKF